MQVKIVNKSSNPSPAYATPLSAGMDIRANLQEPLTLNPLQRMLIPTGLYIALPEGYECQARPRSGLAVKHGITVLNSPGTIDADYRGELKILLVNLYIRIRLEGYAQRDALAATLGQMIPANLVLRLRTDIPQDDQPAKTAACSAMATMNRHKYTPAT